MALIIELLSDVGNHDDFFLCMCVGEFFNKISPNPSLWTKI